MSTPTAPAAPPATVGELAALRPALARLLAPLPPATPLAWEALSEHAAPGRPVDALAACLIILDHLRAKRP